MKPLGEELFPGIYADDIPDDIPNDIPDDTRMIYRITYRTITGRYNRTIFFIEMIYQMIYTEIRDIILCRYIRRLMG